ncbi:MAG: sensor histidine kinase [Eubacteriales bacterium]|jgi:signal transduction histidine kinase
MQDKATQYSRLLSTLDAVDRASVEKMMNILDDRGGYRVIITDDNLVAVYDNSYTENVTNKLILLQEIRVAMEGNDVFIVSHAEDRIISRAASPITIEGRVSGTVYLYESDMELAALLSDIQKNLSTIAFFISIGVIALSLILSRFMMRRISSLLSSIRKVREGDYTHKAKIKGRDEIAEIASEFNALTDRFERVENVRRQFVSDASHELKTPLASIKILADSITQTENMPPELVREFVEDIGEEINRLTRLAEKLLSVTRLDSDTSSELRPVDVKEVVMRCTHMLRRLASIEEIDIVPELSDDCLIDANEDDVYQIVFNLIENAVKYNVRGGRVHVFLFEKEEMVNLIVDDTGVGIPKADLERIYERFYRVDKARSREAGGSGLGLAIVRNAVIRLNGTIETESEQGKGTRITLKFPISGGLIRDAGRLE